MAVVGKKGKFFFRRLRLTGLWILFKICQRQNWRIHSGGDALDNLDFGMRTTEKTPAYGMCT